MLNNVSLHSIDDFYRVQLKSSAVQGSDYINASFIDVRKSLTLMDSYYCFSSLLNTQGYRQKKSYIATQGPLESTVCEFWRMVWENESKCVVLLTKLKENDKACVQKNMNKP